MIDTLYLVLMQLFAVLRVVSLLTLVWWSSLQGLRWPTRELRIVIRTGCLYYCHTLRRHPPQSWYGWHAVPLA